MTVTVRDDLIAGKASEVLSVPNEETIIAVDLDDVLSQTNSAIATWHNAEYSTTMDLSTFYYYYYWKNPHWGTPKETFHKVEAFYKTDWIQQAQPVVGSREGVLALKSMGYKLIIVTARSPEYKHESWVWVERHFPGLFHSLVCTGQFKDSLKADSEIVTKLSKAEVCRDLGAKILIDDSAENAMQCAAHPLIPTRVLLFGDYEWNKRYSGPGDFTDAMSFEPRLLRSGGKEFWKEDILIIPEGTPLQRVQDWAAVIRSIEQDPV